MDSFFSATNGFLVKLLLLSWIVIYWSSLPIEGEREREREKEIMLQMHAGIFLICFAQIQTTTTTQGTKLQMKENGAIIIKLAETINHDSIKANS